MNHTATGSRKRTLGMFALVTLIVASVDSLRGLPPMGELGLSCIFYFLLAAVAFLIPVALVSAELATGWPEQGGVYVWVKEALGERWGFLAIWMQWAQSVFYYPLILAFVAGALAYAFDPELASEKYFVIGTIVVAFWTMTLINFMGMKTSSLITSAGLIGGTLVPGVVLIALGAVWIAMGEPTQVPLTVDSVIPDVADVSTAVLAIGAFLIYAGMEMPAVHANEVKNPQKDYPTALLVAGVIAVFFFMAASVAIAIAVPQAEIELADGVMQAYQTFLSRFNLSWLVPILALLAAFGALGEINTWISGPCRGLQAVAQHGFLPPVFGRANRADAPVAIMLVQSVLVSVVALVFLVLPNISSSFWLLSVMAVQLYLVMYLLMFISAIRLRYTRSDVHRAFRIPVGNLGMWVVAGLGFVASLVAFVVGFAPPSELTTGSPVVYVGLLVVVLFGMASPALLSYQFRKPEWAKDG